MLVFAGVCILAVLGLIAFLNTDIGDGCATIGCGIAGLIVVGAVFLFFIGFFGLGCAVFAA